MRSRWTCLLLALVFLATACSKAPALPAKGGDPDKITTIRVGLFDIESSLETVIAAFQDKYPQYRVVEVPLGSPWDVLTSNRLDKGEVDVVSDAVPLVALLQHDLTTNLDPYIAKSRLDLTPYGSPLESVRQNGHLYGLPVWNDPLMFVYNKKLVEAAKVTIPATSWTWDEFREIAARLTRKEGDLQLYGFDPSFNDVNLAYMLALQKTPAGAMPDPKTYREVLLFFNTMITADRSMPRPAWDDSSAVRANHCGEGQAAICIFRLSSLQRKTRPMTGFEIAPFPAAPQSKPVALATTRTYTILKSSPEPEAAWAFLSFLSGPEGQVLVARQGLLPAYFADATKEAWLQSSPPPPAGAKMLLNAAWYAVPAQYEPTSPLGVFLRGANKLWSGNGELEKIVHEYDVTLAAAKR